VRTSGWRLTEPKSRLLCAHGDLRVPIGGVEAHMAQPTANHIDVDAGFKQMYGARVAQRILTLPMNRRPRSFTTATIPSTANP
jgi:hypothetical protein